MEQVLLFFVYSMIVFLEVLLLGGTLIGYYFTKKREYEISKFSAILSAAKQGKNGEKQ